MKSPANFCRAVFLTALAVSAGGAVIAQQKALTAVPPKEGDYVIKDFKLGGGETLPEVNMHYTTIGTPQRDASGKITNAVVVLHGTNRAGKVFLIPSFAGVLFGPGQLLDTSKYYVILPDQFGAGMGKSTKPSEGLRGKFPHYDYADMVHALQTTLKEGLHVDHLRLFVGTSMGCMQGFMWSEEKPGDVDAYMLLSCLPVQVGGRNRMVRKIMIDDVRDDPAWNNGNYTEQPYGLRAALGHLLVVGSAPTLWQEEYGTAALADKYVDDYIAQNMKSTDANDFIYQYDASRNYNPEPDLGKISDHIFLVNVMDDFWNPGEMGVAEREMKKVNGAHFVLLPVTEATRGHYTFFQAPVWQKYLAQLLAESKPTTR
jgi:homoserine O-acetyltransferase